jgi:signal peptidase
MLSILLSSKLISLGKMDLNLNPFRKKKWYTKAGYVVSLFLLIVLLYGIIGYASGSIPYYVISDRPSSMSPTINFGGFVLTYKAPFNTLKPGDIIVFHNPMGPSGDIVHRILYTIQNCPTAGSDCLVTKGDNNATNPRQDPWNVTQQEYVGKVILVIPYLGYLAPTIWSAEGPLAYAPIAFIVSLVWLTAYIRNGKNTSHNIDGKEGRDSSVVP